MATTITETRGKKSAIVTTQAGSNNDWFIAVVEKIINEAPLVNSYFFKTPHPIRHLAGQHYELRLTAENGYQAARLYSASTAGYGEKTLQLTVMDVPGGEVSPYIVEGLKEGDEIEIRGPFGRFFVWDPADTQPVLLIGGGSGVIPMHSIFTAHQKAESKAPMKLFYSSHTFEDILFKEDFLGSKDVTITLTKEQPEDWKGKSGRITQKDLEEIVTSFSEKPLCYVCGMTPFVSAVSAGLEALGIPASSIKTERFG